MDIEGSRAMITGAASGIGLEYVKQLLINGAKKIAILDLDKTRGEEAAKTLNMEHGTNKVVFIHCDVSKKENFEKAFQKAIDEIGGLDLVINNAGILEDGRWELSIDINVTAVARGTIMALEAMGKHKGGKGGTVVNIASIAAFLPVNCSPVYSGTKAAVVAMVRSFGHKINFDRYGVRVMALCPGVTTTPLMTEGHKRQRTDEDNEFFHNLLIMYPPQPPTFVAENMIAILKTGSSGDIFVCELDQPAYKIDIPDYQTLKV